MKKAFTLTNENEREFKLKFAKTYDNNIFEQNNLKPVVEDYYRVSDNVFCVADGVTRDSIYGTAVPYPENHEEVEEWIKVYPNPSGAYEAAKICADQFVKDLSKYKNRINKNLILEEVKKINNKIAKINKNRKIDYLANDLFCCVAVGGIIIENTLYCFSIGDCHIATYDENFNEIFTTINSNQNFEKYLQKYREKNEYSWDNPKDRVMVRKDYRNKPEKKYNNKEVSYGVLSGEKEAEHYISVYKIDLDKVKYICAYSDGCEPVFEKKEKTVEIIKNPNHLEKEGKERTLVIYER